MIDYGRLKSAGNATLNNPIVDEDNKLVSIDVTYNEYDRYSGQVIQVKTVTIKRSDIVSYRNHLIGKSEEVAIERIRLDAKSADMLEFINDAKAVAGI